MKDIAIYGFGGLGREVACLINSINQQSDTYRLIGYIDDAVAPGTLNKYGKVLGNIDFVNSYREKLSLIMAIADTKSAISITQRITNSNIDFPNLIAPDLFMFDPESVKMGKGNLIMFACRISCDVVLGDFNLFNGGVVIGHDCMIGSYNEFMPSTRILGGCIVGDNNFFGVKSVLLQGKKVGSNIRVGAGSVIMRDTNDGFLYHGNPAKKVSET